jgi:ABC-2 type transport system permease protein
MKVFDIAFKDMTRSIRNMFLIGMVIIAPLLITGLIYFAFGGMTGGDVRMNPVSVGIVNLDRLPDNAPLEVSLGTNIRDMFFDESVNSWIAAGDYSDETSARNAVDAQEIGVAVIIPSAFTKNYLEGVGGDPIVLLQDPTLTITPNVIRDMVVSMLDGVVGGGIAFQVITERMDTKGLTLDPSSIPVFFERYSNWYADFQRALFHTPENAALVMTSPTASSNTTDTLETMMGLVMAGQLIFFSFFTSAFAMMSILQEDEEGTLQRLFTTPTQRIVILSGKFLAVFLTVIIQGLILMIIAHFAFRVNWGKPTSATLGLIGQMFASVGLGVLLISFVKNTKQAGPILGGGLTGLGMISGLFTTNIDMPAGFTVISNFTPQGWVLKAWRLALAGQPASEMIIPFMVLVGMGVVMFVIGSVVFRRRFA